MTNITHRWLLLLARYMVEWRRRGGSMEEIIAWVGEHAPRDDGVMAAEPFIWLSIVLHRFRDRLPMTELYMARELNRSLFAVTREMPARLIYNMLQLTHSFSDFPFIGLQIDRLRERHTDGALDCRRNSSLLDNMAKDAAEVFTSRRKVSS